MTFSYDYLTMLVVGFLGGFGHCIGMCGGFVAAYSMKIGAEAPHEARPASTNTRPHLLYNLGRITTYAALGAVFGLLGQALDVVLVMRPLQGLLQLVAGICIAVLALEMGAWLPNISRYLPLSLQFRKWIGLLLKRVNSRNTYALGLVLGFIPCGLIYAAGAKAAASGSMLGGFLTMLFLGLGTLPAMLAVGLLGQRVSVGFRRRVFRFAAALVVVIGLITTWRGAKSLMTPPDLHGQAHAGALSSEIVQPDHDPDANPDQSPNRR